MVALELLSKKIDTLKDGIEQLNEANLNEKSKLQAQLAIIEECEKVFENEELLLNYDFSNAIKLIENYNFSISNLSKIISDIQTALLVRQQLSLTKEEMPLEENQESTFKAFVDGLKKVKLDLSKKIQSLTETAEEKKKIDNLESLRNILEGTGRRKYVTTDIFSSFYEEFPLLSLPEEEANAFIDAFYQTKNLNIRQGKEKVDLNEVIALYREYLSPNSMRFFMGLLNDHKNEITTSIDLDNTGEILQFFKDTDLIDKFKRTALLKVSLYGKADYIRDVVYPKIKSEHPDETDTYFEDELATIWIKEKGTGTYRAKPFRVSRGRGENKDTENLYATCHSVDYDEFWENIKILKANRDLFDENAALDDDGANLKLKTLPVWVLKKNIELCRLFGMGVITSVPMTCIERGDIEDKIHLAIELGLLNPPMSQKFLDIDKQIVRNDEFQSNVKKKKLYNQSIRNYFQRYLSMLSSKSINEYAYLTYKLQVEGYQQFYNDFFSDAHAGKGNPSLITEQEKNIIIDKPRMNDFITNNFMIEWYSDFINGYDKYDSIISEYTDSDKKEVFREEGYFDPTILDDDLIKELEENNIVIDTITQNEEVVERKNEFVYLFGDRIISRYKVLRNASILKEFYGTLNKEMLMTSIVRNSFLDNDSFQLIQKQMMERGKTL